MAKHRNRGISAFAPVRSTKAAKCRGQSDRAECPRPASFCELVTSCRDPLAFHCDNRSSKGEQPPIFLPVPCYSRKAESKQRSAEDPRTNLLDRVSEFQRCRDTRHF